MVKDDLIFSIVVGGYVFTAWGLLGDKVNAHVEITRDGQLVKQFLWPAYKVWNIAAHAEDIAADLEHGLTYAGSDLLGGGAVARGVPE